MFLKTGKDVEIRGSSSFPFFRWLKREDPERDTRLYFSKSYIYPLAGGAVRRALRHERLSRAARDPPRARSARRFTSSCWRQRSRTGSPLPLAIAFLATSVVPVYFVWLMPELFNFSLVLYAVFFWAYKEVAGETHLRTPAHLAHLFSPGPASDYIAALLIGARDVLEAAAPARARARWCCSRARRRQWTARGWRSCVICGAVTAALFAAECGDHGRVQLPGRRSKDVLLASPAFRSRTRGRPSTTSVRCAGART